MLHTAMSTSTTFSEDDSISSGPRADDNSSPQHLFSTLSSHTEAPALKPKRKRNKPGNPGPFFGPGLVSDPNAEVVALSPRTLMCTNRYACEICDKGFQREQNLQLHRRGHSLPWRLKPADGCSAPKKKVYVCPEVTCIHHHPSRALGDLTGIKKHFCRKHGEKKWTCEKCSKKYAVLSDWKAHVKTCGTRQYICDCGAAFSRKDSYATHRAFCEALAEESARVTAAAATTVTPATVVTPYTPLFELQQQLPTTHQLPFSSLEPVQNPNPNSIQTRVLHARNEDPTLLYPNFVSSSIPPASQHYSNTDLLQEPTMAGQLATSGYSYTYGIGLSITGFGRGDIPPWQRGDSLLTRDFLGVDSEEEEEMFSLSDSHCLDFMALPTAASHGCSGHANAIRTAPRPEAAGGSGLNNHLPSSATAGCRAWRRLLD